MPADENPDNRQALLAALRHPVRRALLKLVIERGELTPGEGARLLKVNLSDVSYHMRKLAEGGMVVLHRLGQARGAAVHFYVPDSDVAQLPWVREAIGLPHQGDTD